MNKKRILGVAMLVAIVTALTVFKRCKTNPVAVSDSPREEQQTATGKPVVEEWGEESFPASDPPQSW
ncbi:MAG: hypothetical protein HKN91_01100 [Acidimicrobiia bacterium]|nr:hypothetical protein [Acidimicrobiia bacterium]